MKITQITPGLIPIPPNGWGAVEKVIWELHRSFLKAGHESKIIYLDEITADDEIIHIHMGNLANLAHERGIPYYFTMSDHHTYLYGKDSLVFQDNMLAMKNSIRSFVGGKYLVDYFDNIPEYSPYGVNTEYFTPATTKNEHRLLCVANNGYQHSSSEDRKGFGPAIEAAKRLGLPITIAGPSNNKKYFENNPPNYDKLTILYDLSEEQLLQTYREHTIFLHPSQLEAGHPNLTLLEAMACGLPIVGTFEKNNSLRGMKIINPTADEVAEGISTVLDNYNEYAYEARSQAEVLSWDNRAKEFIGIYEHDKSDMRTQLIRHYSKTTPMKKVGVPQIKIHNVDGMFVEILGGPSTNYNVKFIDKRSDKVIYEVNIGNNCWAKSSAKYYIDWKIVITDLNSSFRYEYNLDLKQKKVFITFESKSLGDTLAWLPFVEEFRLRHDCQLVCSTFWNKLFASKYPNITFVEPTTTVHDLTALYRLGLFYTADGIDINAHPSSTPLAYPLQQTASDILGLEYKEIRPLLVEPDVVKDDKLVTIAIHSTAQAKYWNNPDGWQDVVNWLVKNGYTVKLLSKEGDNYMGNKIPNGVIHHPDSSIESVIQELKKSKLFIGLSSGLSWLSWALNTPTLMISGFSHTWAEMQDCIRIGAPQGKCEGCFNKHKLDAGDWNWCPEHKNTERQFECSKSITSDMVIRELEKFLNKKTPRIQVKHLLTRPQDEREQVSINSIKQLEKYGFDYQPIINKVYDELPPKENCRRPNDIADMPGQFINNPGLGKVTGRHYGCYLAHRNAIADIDDVNYDYTLIFEADAYLSGDIENFINTVYEACDISERDNVYQISFAKNYSTQMHSVNSTFIRTGTSQDLAHCYLIANRHKQWWSDRIIDCEWDSADLWLNHIFYKYPEVRYTTSEILCRQAEGMSLIDRELKTWK